ncbi:lantibiotic dehydratase [Actinoplanes siamensis]|uniref:Lantibiotic dehydratase n=2 Tax=Actinoplanes siamensis TaxID=1223317 RepID=A0A919N6N3_9ACTN|nr:lantibiotic dehydratase [Actinoplanes siamensis]
MLRHLLLRRAGFPIDLLTSLAGDEPAAAVRELVVAAGELEAARAEALARALPAEVAAARTGDAPRHRLRELSRWRSALGRRRIQPAPTGSSARLRELADRLARADRRVTALAARLAERRPDDRADEARRLRRLLDDPLVRLALVQLSPSFAERTDRAARSGDGALDAALARRAYLFVQRLAAKNETTSFFGPLTHGRVLAGASGLSLGCCRTPEALERTGFLAFWATAELARAVSRDAALAPLVPVRRNPVVRLTGSGVVLPGGRAVRLPAADRSLIEAADGIRGADALVAHVATGAAAADPDVLRGRLHRLRTAGVLLADVEPASTRLQPLDELRDWLRRSAPESPWPAALDELAEDVSGYARAGDEPAKTAALDTLERRFTALTGAPARRGAGRMYADRMVVYEECRGDGALTVAADVAERWCRQLAPYLDACAEYGRRRRNAVRDLAARVLADASGRLPFLVFADRLAEAAGAGGLAAHRAPVAGFEADWQRLVTEATRDGMARLDPHAVATLAGSARGARFVSPDLLLGMRADGEFAVVGELHPYAYAWGSQALFAPEPDGMYREFAADLGPWDGPRRIATVIRRRQHKGIVSDAFPGRFVEVTGVATRDRARCVAAADLEVRLQSDGPSLFDPVRPLTLYVSEDDHPHLQAFSAVPVVAPRYRGGTAAPRVLVGDVVVQRARWWLGAAALRELVDARSAGARTVAAALLRARTGLPRWVFVKAPGEPKPVCVDLDGSVAVDVLAGLAAPVCRAPDAAELLVEEMCPAPEALWLRRDDGGRPGWYTSELRVAMVRRGR